MNPCPEHKIESCDKCLVVLVDDDDAIREAFAEILQLEGYEVLAFANGRDALDALDRKPCLILLDWMLPGMSGEELLEGHAPKADTPVVVVTAMASWARKIPGISALLAKPVDLDGLLRTVRLHCRHSHPTPPLLAG